MSEAVRGGQRSQDDRPESADTAADRLPPNAHLLGRLAGASPRRFALPEAARERTGRLHLYSLGHAQWLGSAALGVP